MTISNQKETQRSDNDTEKVINQESSKFQEKIAESEFAVPTPFNADLSNFFSIQAL
mgnify:CR=1 FL=1